jgi:hypothetical protein
MPGLTMADLSMEDLSMEDLGMEDLSMEDLSTEGLSLPGLAMADLDLADLNTACLSLEDINFRFVVRIGYSACNIDFKQRLRTDSLQHNVCTTYSNLSTDIIANNLIFTNFPSVNVLRSL